MMARVVVYLGVCHGHKEICLVTNANLYSLMFLCCVYFLLRIMVPAIAPISVTDVAEMMHKSPSGS